MGGEMIFSHLDKPIEDLEAYRKILKEIKDDCAKIQRMTTTARKKPPIKLITNPISNWNNEYIKTREGAAAGQDDDYEMSIDLGPPFEGIIKYQGHFYILFPKDPNKLKILSKMHARGMNMNEVEWIHPYLLKFVTMFPGVFELYYGDGLYGASGDGTFGRFDYQIFFCNGSAEPIRCSYRDPVRLPSFVDRNALKEIQEKFKLL